MDKQSGTSRPSNDPDENRNESMDVDTTLNASTTAEATDGGWTFVTQAHYDPDERRDLTTVIVSAIAEAEDAPITEIKTPPLYEVVDVAAIDEALFGRPEANSNGADSTVEFRYNGYRVSVEDDGWVTVSDRSEGS